MLPIPAHVEVMEALRMAGGNDALELLLIVIGYDLVSYLLHYPSARCVTFKERFVCKSSYLIRDFDINSRFLSPHS